MGACASFPKTLGDAAGKAPAPEQPIEENDKAVEEVKTAVDGEEKKEKSLGSLVESNEQVKEETAAPVVEDVIPAPSAVEVNEKNTDAAPPPAEAKKE